jgi:transporter family protein
MGEGHAGLGLTIAKAAAEWLHGRLTCYLANDGEAFVVQVVLPVAWPWELLHEGALLMREYGWIWLGLLSALGAAGVAIFGSLGLHRVDTLTATTVRSIIMTVTLVAIVRVSGRVTLSGPSTEAPHSGYAWICILLAGLCGAGSWLAYFAALRLGLAGQVAAIDRLSLAFVFVLGWLFLGERYSWRGWLGLALVMVGIVLIANGKRATVLS